MPVIDTFGPSCSVSIEAAQVLAFFVQARRRDGSYNSSATNVPAATGGVLGWALASDHRWRCSLCFNDEIAYIEDEEPDIDDSSKTQGELRNGKGQNGTWCGRWDLNPHDLAATGS